MTVNSSEAAQPQFRRWSLALYSGLLYLFTPLILVYFWRQGRRNPAYRARLQERFGRQEIPLKYQSGVIFHCVSVGEFIAARPLIQRFIQRNPNTPVIITSMTPTASELIQSTFSDQVFHCYLPIDTPSAVRRFLDHAKPQAMVVLETELWPNLVYQCSAHEIPVVLVNGRMSEQSMRGYLRLDWLFKQVWGALRYCGTQTARHAERFTRIGVQSERIEAVGNLKFDVTCSTQLHKDIADYRELFGHRPVITAGSTHEGEEIELLTAFQTILETVPDALFILVPRHQERFQQVADLLEQKGVRYVRRSSGAPVLPSTQVLLADTMGELMLWYGVAQVAFVGGSLITRGGHNPLEPLALAVPIVSGRHVFNFQEVYDELEQLDAVHWVTDQSSLVATLAELLNNDDAKVKTMHAQSIFAQHQGATARYLTLIEEIALRERS